ncbi:MAG: hypothetical protein ACRCX2_27305 [Paraclostridium sp.]
MKITLTKNWQELPYKIFTIQSPYPITVRLETSATTPTGNGQPFSGNKIEKFAEEKVWIKLDYKEVDTLEVEIANFI